MEEVTLIMSPVTRMSVFEVCDLGRQIDYGYTCYGSIILRSIEKRNDMTVVLECNVFIRQVKKKMRSEGENEEVFCDMENPDEICLMRPPI